MGIVPRARDRKAVARLITYLGACAATVRLRHPRFRETVRPATFVIPVGRSYRSWRLAFVAGSDERHAPAVAR